jgi:hypothetical protein
VAQWLRCARGATARTKPSLAGPHPEGPLGYGLRCVLLAGVCLACACSPTVVIGEWTCSAAPSPDNDASSSAEAGAGEAVATPWSTGFEDGFCDYTAAGGFCYAPGSSSYRIVTSPVHTGRFAAAFTVESNATPLTGTQARCVRQGILPAATYYGAWYYIPAVQTNTLTWNLFHFQGGDGSNAALHGLWDVSLVNGPDDTLHIAVYDFLNGGMPDAGGVPPIPIGAWFHLEIYIKRAADTTGELAVYQDGQVALDLTGLTTDDSQWGQWYVGNLANALAPPESTVYVDDVTLSATP